MAIKEATSWVLQCGGSVGQFEKSSSASNVFFGAKMEILMVASM